MKGLKQPKNERSFMHGTSLSPGRGKNVKANKRSDWCEASTELLLLLVLGSSNKILLAKSRVQ